MALIFLRVPVVVTILRFPVSASQIALTSSLMMSGSSVYDYVVSLGVHYDNLYFSTLMSMFIRIAMQTIHNTVKRHANNV